MFGAAPTGAKDGGSSTLQGGDGAAWGLIVGAAGVGAAGATAAINVAAANITTGFA